MEKPVKPTMREVYDKTVFDLEGISARRENLKKNKDRKAILDKIEEDIREKQRRLLTEAHEEGVSDEKYFTVSQADDESQLQNMDETQAVIKKTEENYKKILGQVQQVKKPAGIPNVNDEVENRPEFQDIPQSVMERFGNAASFALTPEALQAADYESEEKNFFKRLWAWVQK